MSTMNDLVTRYNVLAKLAGLPLRKGFDNKAKAEAAIKAADLGTKAKSKPKSAAALRVRKAGAVRTAGPRGFKFGPVWLASVKAGNGPALSPRNLPKLVLTGEAYGIPGASNFKDQAKLAAKIAEAL